MAKLPFKTAPQTELRLIGNEATGTLEFPVIGDLTVREQAYINQFLSANSTFIEIARIANKVAKAAKIQPVAAHRFTTKCVTHSMTGEGTFDEKEENLKIKFAREIEELTQHLLQAQWERQLITATSLIRHRLEGMQDFDIEDARDLSQQLLIEIYSFALMEQGVVNNDGDMIKEGDLAADLGK